MNNNGNTVVGINEEQINSLILKIYDYAENINKIFNELETLVSENMQYFDSDIKNDFRAYHKDLKANFPIVTQNILSYATDLMNLKKKYNVAVSNISSDLNQASSQFKG